MSRTIDTTVVSERTSASGEAVLLVTINEQRWRVTEREVAILVSGDEAAPEWQTIIEGDVVAGACVLSVLQRAVDIRARFSQLLHAVVLPKGAV